MPSKAKYLIAIAALLPLMGQGCAAKKQVGIPEAMIDASVDSELRSASSTDAEERKADSEADQVENDKAELNSYTEVQYDLP